MRGKVVREKDGSLTDGRKTIRYGDYVRVPGGRIGDVVFTRAYITVTKPGRYDSLVRRVYRPQVMVHFDDPTHAETYPFRFLKVVVPPFPKNWKERRHEFGS
jgi:hypothetical protein